MGDAAPTQPPRDGPNAEQALLDAISRLVPAMRSHATLFDSDATFPAIDIQALHRCGALTATLPARHGGLGFGIGVAGTLALFELLRLLGNGNMSVGRLVEGHVNALRLIWCYGTDTQLARAAADANAGHLFAIWNTDAPQGVRSGPHGALTGRKAGCSAAGFATRAVITVDHPDRSRMLIVALAAGERAGLMQAHLHGMRATGAGWIDFESYRPRAEDWLGEPDDYLREPEFSAGAWRTLAVLLGGIEALGATLREQLSARGRDTASYQVDRIAQALIAEQTALLWTQACARLVGSSATDPADMVGYVNLARRAVEMAGFSVIELAQRSLGLSALISSNPMERMVRDLATYLRQPAIDMGVAEAVAHFIARPLP